MGRAKIYAFIKFEVSIFTRSKDTAYVPFKWLDARVGVPKLTRVSPSFFNRPHQIWHQYSRMVSALMF